MSAQGPKLDVEQRQEASRLEERCADSDEIAPVLYELIAETRVTPPHAARCRTPGCYARQRHASGKCQVHRVRHYGPRRPRLCLRGCGSRVQCAECNRLGEGYRCRVCAPMRVCLACREMQSVEARGRRALVPSVRLHAIAVRTEARRPARAHVRRDEAAADAIGRQNAGRG